MPQVPDRQVLTRLLRALPTSTDPELADRILLEAVHAAGMARATGLVPPAGSGEPARLRGDLTRLPPRDRVDDLLAGAWGTAEHWGRRLPSGRALLLCGLGDDRGRREAAEELAELWEEACREPVAALPSPPPAPRERRLLHDLRNHLAALCTTREAVARLRETLTPDEAAHYAKAVDGECRRAGEMVASALADRGGDPPDPDTVARALGELALAERAAFAAAEVAFEVTVDPALDGVRAPLPARDTERIVRNLLVNAREACQRAATGGRVRLEVLRDKSDRGGIVIAVRDNGPGVPAEVRGRLFQEGSSSRAESSEHGLGLACVAELAERAGGGVSLRELPTGGVCCQVWIPAR